MGEPDARFLFIATCMISAGTPNVVSAPLTPEANAATVKSMQAFEHNILFINV